MEGVLILVLDYFSESADGLGPNNVHCENTILEASMVMSHYGLLDVDIGQYFYRSPCGRAPADTTGVIEWGLDAHRPQPSVYHGVSSLPGDGSYPTSC